MAVVALLLKLGMTVDDRPGYHELFEEVLRMRSPRQSAHKNYSDHPTNCESKAHWRAPHSKEVRRKNVDGGCKYQKEKQWKVKDVPETEEALVRRKGSRFPYGRDM